MGVERSEVRRERRPSAEYKKLPIAQIIAGLVLIVSGLAMATAGLKTRDIPAQKFTKNTTTDSVVGADFGTLGWTGVGMATVGTISLGLAGPSRRRSSHS